MPAAVLTTLTAWLKGEIQNYAMVGDSLWVLTEERPARYPSPVLIWTLPRK